MTDYSSLAVYDVNAYLWEQIKASGLMNDQDYYADGYTSPLVPIIPAQQIPEFNNALPGKPYIIYDYERLPSQETWWFTHEIINYMVVSTDYEFINSMLNLFDDVFRRYDESAKDIFKSNILSNNFEFKYTAIHSLRSPEPMKNEGGIRVGYVDILCAYIRKLDSNGRF